MWRTDANYSAKWKQVLPITCSVIRLKMGPNVDLTHQTYVLMGNVGYVNCLLQLGQSSILSVKQYAFEIGDG